MKKLAVLICLAIVVAPAVVAITPLARWWVIGWVKGEPFYRYRPASYYAAKPEPECLTDGLVNARRAPETVPVLRSLVLSPDESVRRRALWELHEMRGVAAPAVPELITLLSHPDPDTRMIAIGTLCYIGPPAYPAIGPLSRIAGDYTEYRSVRSDARYALRRIAPWIGMP
jgi:hypothetical protein